MSLGFYPVTPGVAGIEVHTACVADISRARDWAYAEHAPIEGKPKKQFTGPGAPALTVSLKLNQELVEVAGTIAQLAALADDGEVLQVQSTEGAYYGMLVLESMTDRVTESLDGIPVAATVQLELSDPGEDEVALLATPPRSLAIDGTAADAVLELPADAVGGAPGAVTPEEIARA